MLIPVATTCDGDALEHTHRCERWRSSPRRHAPVIGQVASTRSVRWD
ncbi:hypothetical protein PXO_05818 [Xanthomonas oryzae pv. oryzae PXO99A]|uniref:Uncharacterized protein n=1 Tax=Xanthomonas oryzae pv. oryzae (strain PXO99A) TaxID=360094 RepID=A0A0K0GIB2_XANOP|nr:hypothetical protein PXO_05818 [Xanthomonas oryzae pv. oryzae PXO99A]